MNRQTFFFAASSGAENGEKELSVYKMYPLVSQWKRGSFVSDTMAGHLQRSVRNRVLRGG